MPTDRAAFYDACIALAPRPALIPEAFERIAPYFDQADADMFALCEARDFDAREASDALTRASEASVRRIIPVSLSAPIAKPEWMAARHHDALVVDCLVSSVRDPLGQRIGQQAEDAKLRCGMPFWHAFTRHLGDALWTSLENCVPDSYKVPLALHHGMAQWHRLFLYLASAATADAATMARLAPLVSLCARTLPLGEKRDEPGTWLVLVK
jgi:hypothetical protein